MMLCVMVLVSDFVYAVWVGSDVTVSHELSVCTATYIFILCYSQRYSYILNGLNVLRIQLVFIVIAAAVFLPLAWYVCKTFQTVTSLVWVMCAVNIPGLLANIWKYHTMFRRIQATE
jgi:O-antigen/teichoic acid export membrane protein